MGQTESIHHLPAGVLGGASGEEHQQLLFDVHLATGHVLSPLDALLSDGEKVSNICPRQVRHAGEEWLLLINLPAQVCVGRSRVCSPWLTALFHTTPPHW
jgi:hypothetical protein